MCVKTNLNIFIFQKKKHTIKYKNKDLFFIVVFISKINTYIDKLSESLKYFCWNYNFLIKIYTPHKKT